MRLLHFAWAVVSGFTLGFLVGEHTQITPAAEPAKAAPPALVLPEKAPQSWTEGDLDKRIEMERWPCGHLGVLACITPTEH